MATKSSSRNSIDTPNTENSSWVELKLNNDLQNENDIESHQPTGFNQIPDSTLNLLSPESYIELFQAMDIDVGLDASDVENGNHNDNHYHIPQQNRHFEFNPTSSNDDKIKSTSPPSLRKTKNGKRRRRRRACAQSFIFSKNEVLAMLNKSNADDHIFSDDEGDDFDDIIHEFQDIIYQSPHDKNNKKKIKNNNNNNNKSILNINNIIDNIADKFKYIKQLGKGASCRVLLCSDKSNSSKLFALKELPKKNKLSAMQFDREVRLLSLLSCTNIMKYIDCYMDKKCYYIVLEYCSGPTLLERVISIKHFNEKIAANYIKCILNAVNEMHQKNIVHRDLKLNNLIFDKPFNDNDDDQKPELKLIDFGDSRIIEENGDYKTCVGTLNYLSPEMMRNKKGWEIKKSDMWSVGIITFILNTGQFPFYAKTKNDTLNKIKIGKYSYPKNCNLSNECKNFISNLLELDTKKRMSCQEALKHKWIIQQHDTDDHYDNDDDDDEKKINNNDNFLHLEKLKQYDYGNKLKQILINGILSELDDKEKTLLNEALMHLEKDDEKHDHIANDLIVRAATMDHLLLGNITDDDDDDDDDDDELIIKQRSHSTKLSVHKLSNYLSNLNDDNEYSQIIKDMDPSNSGFVEMDKINQYKTDQM